MPRTKRTFFGEKKGEETESESEVPVVNEASKIKRLAAKGKFDEIEKEYGRKKLKCAEEYIIFKVNRIEVKIASGTSR